MGGETILNHVKRYAYLFFLSFAIYGFLSSFHMVDFIATTIRSSLKEHVFFLSEGQILPITGLSSMKTKVQSKQVSLSYIRPDAVKISSLEMGTLLDDFDLNKAMSSFQSYTPKLKVITKRVGIPQRPLSEGTVERGRSSEERAQRNKEEEIQSKEEESLLGRVEILQSIAETITQSNRETITQSNRETITQSNRETITQSNRETITQSNREDTLQSNRETITQSTIDNVYPQEITETQPTPSKEDSTHRRRERWRSKQSKPNKRRQFRDPPPEANPNYQVAMSRRRNYTEHYPIGSQEFKQQAKENLLNFQTRGICEKGRCIKFISNQEVPYDYSTEWKYYPENYEITMVATATLNRIQFFPSIFERWGGPVCVAIWAKEDDLDAIVNQIRSFEDNIQVTTIIYHVPSDHPNYYDFPVNMLRNICIRNIKTSHFMFLDIDMWPTPSMHRHLLDLPKVVMDDSRTAIVIPPVFLNSKRIQYACKQLDDCFAMSRRMGPENKTELSACYARERCLLVKQGGFAHLFATSKWLKMNNETMLFTRIQCFPDRLQEPYLVLKYTRDLPLFDERFVNYGYNKIEYMEQLRFYIGKMYILTQDFALDMYHQKSTFAKKFKASIHSIDKPEMDVLWQVFRNELRVSVQGKRRRLPICNTLNDMYDFSQPSV